MIRLQRIGIGMMLGAVPYPTWLEWTHPAMTRREIVLAHPWVYAVLLVATVVGWLLVLLPEYRRRRAGR